MLNLLIDLSCIPSYTHQLGPSSLDDNQAIYYVYQGKESNGQYDHGRDGGTEMAFPIVHLQILSVYSPLIDNVTGLTINTILHIKYVI